MRIRVTHVYRAWINALRDQTVRARIQTRVNRLVHGNPGIHRNLVGGISELKIDLGPGYRVYYKSYGPNDAKTYPQVETRDEDPAL
jgi:putative addiction module killer protein